MSPSGPVSKRMEWVMLDLVAVCGCDVSWKTEREVSRGKSSEQGKEEDVQLTQKVHEHRSKYSPWETPSHIHCPLPRSYSSNSGLFQHCSKYREEWKT